MSLIPSAVVRSGKVARWQGGKVARWQGGKMTNVESSRMMASNCRASPNDISPLSADWSLTESIML